MWSKVEPCSSSMWSKARNVYADHVRYDVLSGHRVGQDAAAGPSAQDVALCQAELSAEVKDDNDGIT